MSNKMPPQSAKPTKSGLKLIFAAAFIFIIVIFLKAIHDTNNSLETKNSDYVANYCLQSNESNASKSECKYNLEPADTNAKRIRGLSGRDNLPAGNGMLFIFDKVEEECMWMKDMKFSIDIMWLNDKKEIIKIENGVSPDSYPNSFCADNTKYVIELNNGEAEKANYKTGQRLNF